MVLLHLLEAERQLLRLLGEDGELLDDLLGRHLSPATALHGCTADRRRLGAGSLEDVGGNLCTGHLHVITTAALGDSAAALAAGERESRT